MAKHVFDCVGELLGGVAMHPFSDMHFQRAERTHEESGKKAQESGRIDSPLRAKRGVG